VVEYIKSFNLDIIQSDKTILNGKELDIYIPDKKIAIEFDGDYWHSAVFKHPTYHQEKTIACISKGIHLIHIFEYEWRNQEVRDKIKAYIKHLLDNSINKIYARNTEIKAVETAEAKEFIEKYHLQGYANAAVSLGCYYKNELIGIMTFGAPRFNSNYEYELIRLCWKTDWLVIGGSNKLFSQFIKEYNPNSIVSYCDLAKFSGTIYLELGFETSKTEVTKPSYVWIDSRNLTVYTRYQTQKQKLLDLGLGSLGDTEEEIMENLGYLKVYNSGNLRFHWNKN
jgi:hypothetical protein